MSGYEGNTNSGKNASQVAGAVNADMNMSAMETQMDKFNASQGHGFAAEQANHLYDILTGNDATIVGGDNAKDGADRLVNGVNIQTKYCGSASQSVAAAFDNGQYRYLNPDGSLMQLEVPSDQYEAAVELMTKRIEQGQVPGVSNPNEAGNIVRRGHFTYTQAQNIAKFGTIESLTFDAVNGAIVSTSAFGITAAITFALSLWNGDRAEIALEHAAYAGLQVGGASFATTVITSQLARTGVNTALTNSTNVIVKALGTSTSTSLATALNSGANIYTATGANAATKLLRGNFVTGAVMTLVLSAKDIRNAFSGRISGKQLFKNVATIAGGMAGGTVGYVAGSIIAGPIGGFVGSVAGGTLGGKAVHTVAGNFIEDDAVALVKILEDSFCQYATEYVLTKEEVEIILIDLGRVIDAECLLNMFASFDKKAYADNLIREQIEKLIRMRSRVYIPSEQEFINGIAAVCVDINTGQGIFSVQSNSEVDPVAIGQRLLGKELQKEEAMKAWYATKQMNATLMQGERMLNRMAQDEQQTKEKMTKIYEERVQLKSELIDMLRRN